VEFHLVDIVSYPRRDHFEYYLEHPCSYNVTASVDLTTLSREVKARGLRSYPALIWILATAVNRYPEFRMMLDEEGRLGYADVLSPMYTVLNGDTKTYSCLYTNYNPMFSQFYLDSALIIEQYAGGTFRPQTNIPPNVFSITSVPWLDFSSFSLNIPDQGFLPVFTTGKYTAKDDRTTMPLSVLVNHAVCDGWHVAQLFAEVQRLADICDEWLVR